MQVECIFSSPLYRYEPDDFIRHLDLTIFDFDDDDDRIMLGKFAADLLPMNETMNADESLLDVCDADSAGWEEVYSILFEDGHEFKEELQIEAAVDNVLFIWKSVLHPKLEPYRSGVLETVCRLFSSSVIAMWNYATELTAQELADLGFRKIADSKLIYRDMSMVADYERRNPNGTETPSDLVVTAEDEAWVKERWKDSDRNYVDREQYGEEG